MSSPSHEKNNLIPDSSNTPVDLKQLTVPPSNVHSSEVSQTHGLFDDEGKIRNQALRMFLLDPLNREKAELSPATDHPNYLKQEAILPIVEWATGIVRSSSQSVADYFSVDPHRSLVQVYMELHGSRFTDGLHSLLQKLGSERDGEKKEPGTRMSDRIIDPTNAKLGSIIRSQPVECCELLLKLLSPQEGFGSREIATALQNFHMIVRSSES